MFNPLRAFAEPEHAVLSLEVQAAMAKTGQREQGRFELLVRHFLDSFFSNEMVSADGEAKARLLQAIYGLALPGLLVAIYLIPAYHAPQVRPYWLQASDHYFYIVYAMVTAGCVTLFEWDIFFPNLVDVFVLSTLPVRNRDLFLARMLAVSIFLGLVVLGANALGMVFHPAASDLPSPGRHFLSHVVSVMFSGIFAAGFFVALQSVLMAALGPRLLQKVSPFLQGLSVTVLLTIFFTTPFVSRLLEASVRSHGLFARCFPPFWFLAMYQRLLYGDAPAFTSLASTGLLATLLALGLALLFYPLAYWRKVRELVEGRPVRARERWSTRPMEFLLDATCLRNSVRRAIYRFLTRTLLRTQRHRVYLALYGGAGLALALSSALLLQVEGGRLRIALSAQGLRATVPIVAFWTVAGVRAAFVSPVDERGSWVFRLILGRPRLQELGAARLWVLLWSFLLTLLTVSVVVAIAPPELRGWRPAAALAIGAVGLSLLLRDVFFLRVLTLPFTGARSNSKSNLAVVLIQYVGFFPPLVLLAAEVEAWLQTGPVQMLEGAAMIVAAHLLLNGQHERIVAQNAHLLDVDEDEEEFPQRLGLRY